MSEVVLDYNRYDTDWMAYIKEHSVPWEERKGAAVGRYNLMCPHNAPLDRNAKEMKCAF